jgi:hypothetical protein
VPDFSASIARLKADNAEYNEGKNCIEISHSYSMHLQHKIVVIALKPIFFGRISSPQNKILLEETQELHTFRYCQITTFHICIALDQTIYQRSMAIKKAAIARGLSMKL